MVDIILEDMRESLIDRLLSSKLAMPEEVKEWRETILASNARENLYHQARFLLDIYEFRVNLDMNKFRVKLDIMEENAMI